MKTKRDTILVVDDVPMNRRLLRLQLESKEYAVLEAAEGGEALRLLATHPVDCIISDVLMPGMDGLRFCIAVRRDERLKHIPFIAVTSTMESDSEEHLAYKAGVDRFITKPAPLEKLHEAIQELAAQTGRRPTIHVSPKEETEVVESYASALARKLEQKNAELEKTLASLGESEARFQLISRATNDAVWDWNIATNDVFLSEGFVAFGYAPQEIKQSFDFWFDRVHPDDQEPVISSVDRVLKSGEQVWTAEYRFRRRDGSWAHLFDRGYALRDEEGAAVRMVGAMMDVTGRKRAEESLREAEARFRSLVEQSLAGIYIVQGSRFAYVNPRVCAILGYSADELTSRPITDFVWEDDREAVRENIRKRLAGEIQSLRYPLRMKHRDGRMVYGEVHGARSEFNGQPAIIGAMMDITEQKRAEEELRQAAALLDLDPDAVFVRNMEDRIVFWSKGAERIYGWTADEILGRVGPELLHTSPSDQFKEAQRIVREKGEWSGELQHTTKDGRKLTVSSRWRGLRDPEGRVNSILNVNTDVTETKRLEAQMLRTQRIDSIGSLAGGVAHDLNNVLAPILMGVELLRMRFADPETGRLLDTLEGSARRGADLVKQILTFAHGKEGERQSINLKHLLDDLRKMVRNTFPQGIQFKAVVPPGLWSANANATQLYQVLLNLIVNARDAMPRGGMLTIEARNLEVDAQFASSVREARPGHHVVISVRDTGTGIPEAIREKIFDPFFTTKEPGKGTGIGLATVANVVKAHGGFLQCESEVGSGTTFRLYLPAEIGGGIEAVVAATRSLPAGNGELVLVVDDEAAVRSITKATLEAYGYQVETASDGTEALTRFVQLRNDVKLVVTDMQMPYMDGPATIRALRQLKPGLRIIATSGVSSILEVLENSGLQVQSFLTKPYTADRLLQEVHDALADQDLRPRVRSVVRKREI